MTDRRFTERRALLAAGTLAALCPSLARARTYPTRPVRWLVGYPPGGGTDTIARIVAGAMEPMMGQTLVVDNKPGASANIAGHELVRAPADGYTVMSADNGLLVFNPVMYRKMGFNPAKEMSPVGLLGRLHLLIAVQPGHPATSYRDLVAWVKGQKDPVQYAASSIGSPLHLAMARLASETGLKMTQIPYKGAAPAMADFLAGSVQVMCIDYSSAAQHVKAGKMRVLAVTSGARIPALPDVPTVTESGGPAGFEAYAWQGVVVPRATPDPVIAQFNTDLNAALNQKTVIQRLGDLGIEATPSTTAHFASFWNKESEVWQPLIRTLGIAMD